MNNGYCMILSKYRLYQGILLCRSLLYNAGKCLIFILCIDDDTYEALSRLKMDKVTLIKANEIEDDMLIAIKNQRLLNEYCWTLKPFLIEHIFMTYRNLDSLTYTDADICFFNDPAPIFDELSKYHILLSRHDFPELHKGVANICGTYNSGYVCFKRSRVTFEALKWWKKQCYDWCYDKAEEGKFGDQKYLDMLPTMVDGVSAINTPGVNIAPWNDEKFKFSVSDGKVYVNNDKLICYHYSGLRLVDDDLYALVLGSKELNPIVHSPYIYLLKAIKNEVDEVMPELKAYQIEDRFKSNAKYFKAADLGV